MVTHTRGAMQRAILLTVRELPLMACLRSDRLSAYEALDLPFAEAMSNELRRGVSVLGEGVAGAQRFASGVGRQ